MRSFYSTDSECTRTDDSDSDGDGARGASAAGCAELRAHG